jgi:hypothetical protein
MPPTYSATLFPDVIGQAYRRGRTFRTLRSQRDTASDQLASLNGSNVLWRFSLGWQPLAQANAEAIYHAIEFMGGDCAGLYFFEWESLTWTNVYVGLGDGTANPITLPVKAASGGTTTVTANGTPVAGTFSAATGTNGEDRFTPGSPVTNGATVRATFTGRRRRRVMVADGATLELELTTRFDSAGALMWNATLELLETDGSGFAMSAFPDLIGEQLKFRPNFVTRLLPLGELHRQRHRKFLRPRFDFDIAFQLLQPSDALSIDNHVLSQVGSGIAFDWFFWRVFHWLWVPIGTGDGSTTAFTIPAKTVSNLEVFTGTGTPATVSLLSPGTGPLGEDVATLSAAPISGVSVWGNFSGRRRFRVTYDDDFQPLTRLADTGYFTFQSRLVQAK